MALDPLRTRFLGKAIVAAHSVGGSIEGDDARPFVDLLYHEWSQTGQDISEAASWLQRRLTGEFKTVAQAPVWIEDEPAWPFLDGRPMVFISQATTGELSPGGAVYLFGARRAKGTGFEVVYRTVSQFEVFGEGAREV
jgi:hypothetical protein